VHGTDTAGQAFKENTWTISVNKQGGRIATFHQLAADDQIVIENPLLGRTAKARVNRVCEKRFAEDPYEVCVELMEPQNVWGIKLPPEDWQKERQIILEDRKSPAAPQAPKTPAATAEKGGMVETAHLAPRGSPAELGEPGGLSQFNMAVNALSRFAGEAHAPPTQPASHRQDAIGVPKAPAGHPQAPDPLALTALHEKIGEAQALRQELSALTDRVQSARVELENFLSKAALEFQAQSKRAAEQAKAELDELVKDAAIQARKIYKEESGTAAKAISLCVDSAVDTLNRALDEAASKLQAGRQTLELNLKKATEECLPRLADESASVLEKFRAETQALAAQLQSEVESTAREFSEKASGDISDLQGLLESLRTQIHLTAEESAARVTAEVRSRAEQALQELPDRLYKGVGMAALVAKEWEEQAKTHLEVHLSHMLEVFQKQLEGLTMAAQERQRSDAAALEGLLQSRLHQAARLFEGVEADTDQSKGVAREEFRNSSL
jgi:hypothetical protein